MKTLEEYDEKRDSAMIAALERAEQMAEDISVIENQAISNALMTHPVTRFVLHSRVESTMYPALQQRRSRTRGRRSRLPFLRRQIHPGGCGMISGSLPIRILCTNATWLSVDWDICNNGFAYPVLRADGPIVLSDYNLEVLRRALDRVEMECHQTNEKIEEEELCLYEDRSDEFVPEGF